MSKVRYTAYGCWEWTGALSAGYGAITVDGRMRLAHRVAYVLLIGPLDDDLDLHHECANPSCINPWHLTPLTRREHMIAEGMFGPDHCKRGHVFTPENTGRTPKGGRLCILCKAIKLQEWRKAHPDRVRAQLDRQNQRRRANYVPKPARTCCNQGHPLEGENLYRHPDGSRVCRICMRAAQKRHKERKKGG